MRLGILEAGRPPAPLDDTHGRYPAMFDDLLRPHLPEGIEIVGYAVIDGEFPDSVVECDAWQRYRFPCSSPEGTAQEGLASVPSAFCAGSPASDPCELACGWLASGAAISGTAGSSGARLRSLRCRLRR